MSQRTTEQACREILAEVLTTQRAKSQLYGPSLGAFRFASLVEKIAIKAKRIRTISSTGSQRVEDPIREDLLGVISYSLVALGRPEATGSVGARSEPNGTPRSDTNDDTYDDIADQVGQVLMRKNHDYGEAWRQLSFDTMIDEIVARTIRISHLNQHDPLPSSLIADQLYDLVNYATFCIILDEESSSPKPDTTTAPQSDGSDQVNVDQ